MVQIGQFTVSIHCHFRTTMTITVFQNIAITLEENPTHLRWFLLFPFLLFFQPLEAFLFPWYLPERAFVCWLLSLSTVYHNAFVPQPSHCMNQPSTRTVFLFLCSARSWFQGFTRSRQVLHHWAASLACSCFSNSTWLSNSSQTWFEK